MDTVRVVSVSTLPIEAPSAAEVTAKVVPNLLFCLVGGVVTLKAVVAAALVGRNIALTRSRWIHYSKGRSTILSYLHSIQKREVRTGQKASTAGGGARPLGDLMYADVSESVLCWLPVNRSTLDALSHACRATRAQTARHRDFGRTTFVCERGCHIRFSQELDAPKASCAAILRHSDQLSSLHGLSLNNTSLRADEIAAVVSKCPSLRTLRLGGTCADDKVVAVIACLAHLETLDVLCCKCITDFCSLAACRTLKTLNVGGTYVDDRALVAVVSLPCLEELSLDGCLSVTDFTPLCACLLLKRLRAGGTKIDDRGLAAVVPLPCLEELFFDCCESITDFTPLRSCKMLKRLKADHTNINDGGLAAIASLPCLEELSLNGCSFITDYTTLRSCKSLKRLSLNQTWHNNKVDDRALAAIVYLSCLEVLSLDSCEYITDFTPLRACKSLKVLSLGWTSIDDGGVAAVASLPRLEELDISGCKVTTDVSRHSLKVTTAPHTALLVARTSEDE